VATSTKTDERTDEVLVDAIRAGDDAALDVLLERHAPSILRFGMKMCRDEADAEDVLQDTLLAAARGLRQFRGASAVSTWLYAIARSACVKKRRRAVPEMVGVDHDEVMELASPAAPPDESVSERQIGAALEASIAALAPPYREVLLLRDVEGLSASEVASVVGVAVPAVKSRLHRARLAVRERLLPFLEAKMPARQPGCPDIAPMLSRYLEGEIGPDDCAAMERHVESCESCQLECNSLRRILSLCQSSGHDAPVPVDVQAAVRRALGQLSSN
jgi:RNA polymerase sigma-70 factor (ECF subfamily)